MQLKTTMLEDSSAPSWVSIRSFMNMGAGLFHVASHFIAWLHWTCQHLKQYSILTPGCVLHWTATVRNRTLAPSPRKWLVRSNRIWMKIITHSSMDSCSGSDDIGIVIPGSMSQFQPALEGWSSSSIFNGVSGGLSVHRESGIECCAENWVSSSTHRCPCKRGN